MLLYQGEIVWPLSYEGRETAAISRVFVLLPSFLRHLKGLCKLYQAVGDGVAASCMDQDIWRAVLLYLGEMGWPLI